MKTLLSLPLMLACAALLLFPPPPARAADSDALPGLYIIGDSTAARSSKLPLIQGWGEPFQAYFDPAKITVVNAARGGRSSRTFITEGHMDEVVSRLKPGDTVLVQWGHNDPFPINDTNGRGSLFGLGEETQDIVRSTTGKPEVVHTYGWYMRKMIGDIRDKGANPILLTLTVRDRWIKGKIERSPDQAPPSTAERPTEPTRYSVWTTELARTLHVPLLDVHNAIADRYDREGPNTVSTYFHSAGDPTHRNPRGADVDAEVTLACLKALKGPGFDTFLSQKGKGVPAADARYVVANAAAPAACGIARTIIVAKDGKGQFDTVQAAINSIPENNHERIVLQIRPGTYKECIHIPRSKPFLTLRGDSAQDTILTFDNYATKLGPNGKPLGTSGSASFYEDASDFAAENVTFENTAYPRKVVAQALALSVNGDRCVFRNCRFRSWQDTLYTGSEGRQYYENCNIEGDVDFIFGFNTAVFDHCHIQSKGPGYVTAHARTAADQPTGYVFRDCDLTGTPDLPPASVYLGRPWRPYSRVVYIDCKLGPQIRPEGWNNWSKTENEATAWYGEYDSTGPGANPKARASWSRQLSKADIEPFATNRFLAGSDGWEPQHAAL